MPKKSGLINAKEREIAIRVRRVRYSNQQSQPAFARALGISRDRLASIEYARTPLTVELADKIAGKFDVGLSWLATGEGSMKPSIGKILTACPEIKGKSLFSNTYSAAVRDRLIKNYEFNFFTMAAVLTDVGDLPKGKAVEQFLAQFQEQLSESFRALPHAGKEKLLALFVRSLSRFNYDWEMGRRDNPGQLLAEAKKEDLTETATSDKTESVQGEWPKLKKRIQAATAEAGSKSKLASFLGVELAQLSKWLTDSDSKREPGAEYTLQMQAWVTDPKRQK